MPSGASTGSHEAVELRDNDKAVFFGKGVKKAVRNINNVINLALGGRDALCQSEIDKKLIEIDGTDIRDLTRDSLRQSFGSMMFGCIVLCTASVLKGVMFSCYYCLLPYIAMPLPMSTT